MAAEGAGGQRNQVPGKAGGLAHASLRGGSSCPDGRGSHDGSGRHGSPCPDKPHTELVHESSIVSGLSPHAEGIRYVSLRDGKSHFCRWSSIRRLIAVILSADYGHHRRTGDGRAVAELARQDVEVLLKAYCRPPIM